jgi:hypothetical protein
MAQIVKLPDGSTVRLGKKAAKAYALASLQAEQNKQAATAQQNLNMVDQVTPQGNIKYTQVGTNPDGTPKYQATSSLSPEQQALYDQDVALSQQYGQVAGNQLGAVSEQMSSPLDLGEFDPTQVKDNRLYDLQSKYLDRDYARQDEALEQRLANQGIVPGMPAYERARQTMLEAQNYGRDQLLLQGDQQAFNQGMAGRQNSNNEMLTQRNQPLQELNAFRTGSQVSQPNFVTTPQAGVANADMLGTYGNMYSANKSAQAAQTAGLYGGLGAIGGGLTSGIAYALMPKKPV